MSSAKNLRAIRFFSRLSFRYSIAKIVENLMFSRERVKSRANVIDEMIEDVKSIAIEVL